MPLPMVTFPTPFRKFLSFTTPVQGHHPDVTWNAATSGFIVRKFQTAVTWLRAKRFELCKSLNTCPGHGHAYGNLPNSIQEPPVLHNSSIGSSFWRWWKFMGNLLTAVTWLWEKQFKFCKRLNTSSGHVLLHGTPSGTTLSPTTPSIGHKDMPSLDRVRGISGRRPENKSC